MGDILEFYQHDMDGNKWEDLCNKVYKMRYMKEGYEVVPARYKGDGGIEGFTSTGIVTQCYYPEENYSPNELYEKLREKVTTDIDKIKIHENDLYKLGVSEIKEWHFITPEYKDKRILEHLNKKKNELIEQKRKGEIKIVSDDIKLYIKDQDSLIPELQVLTFNFKEYKIDMPEITGIDYTKCDSKKMDNIKRKLNNLLLSTSGEVEEEELNKLVNIYVQFYLKGLQVLNMLERDFPIIYEKLIELENSYKADVEIKCMVNQDKSMNNIIFQETLNEFQEKLRIELGDAVTESFIGKIKQELIGKWLADCPLNFK